MHSTLLFFAILFSLSILSSLEAKKTLNGFTIDLIHRDSPISPFHNSSISQSKLIQNAARRSISRINRMLRLMDEQNVEIVTIPNQGDYLMKFFIGTPPVEFLAVADTGSDLLWLPCLPCNQCSPKNAFDPTKSSSFTLVPCESQNCISLPNYSCGNSNQCKYFYQYGDRSFTVGDLAAESINFSSNGSKTISFPNSLFGCGHENEFGETQTSSEGIVGLGGGPLSLISQLAPQIGPKFSYCLLPFSSNSTSKLKLGNSAIISGNEFVSTPLLSKNPSAYYYINLEGITIGEKLIQTGQSGGNIVIDSGTTLTMLESGFYNKLRDLMTEAIEGEVVIFPPEPLDLCFGNGTAIEVPDLVFRFTGADLKLNPENLFALMDDLLCLLVIPSERISILGNIAQIDIQVAYDLEGKTVSFAPADCSMQ